MKSITDKLNESLINEANNVIVHTNHLNPKTLDIARKIADQIGLKLKCMGVDYENYDPEDPDTVIGYFDYYEVTNLSHNNEHVELQILQDKPNGFFFCWDTCVFEIDGKILQLNDQYYELAEPMTFETPNFDKITRKKMKETLKYDQADLFK